MFYVIYVYISHRYAMSISHMAFIMAMVHIYVWIIDYKQPLILLEKYYTTYAN